MNDWKRIWRLIQHEGLPDLNATEDDDWRLFAGYSSNNEWHLEEIADTPCLILLGDSGIGKTTTIQSEVESFRQGVSPNRQLLYVELGAISSCQTLQQDLFATDANR